MYACSKFYTTEYVSRDRLGDEDVLGIVAAVLPVLARARNLCLQGSSTVRLHRPHIKAVCGAVFDLIRHRLKSPSVRVVAPLKTAAARLQVLTSDLRVFGGVAFTGVWFTRCVLPPTISRSL